MASATLAVSVVARIGNYVAGMTAAANKTKGFSSTVRSMSGLVGKTGTVLRSLSSFAYQSGNAMAIAAAEAASFASHIGKLAFSIGSLPGLLVAASAAVVIFDDALAKAWIKTGQFFGFYKDITEAERQLAESQKIGAALEKIAEAKEREIAALKKRLAILKGAQESDFATGQAKLILLEIEAIERSNKFTEELRRHEQERLRELERMEAESRALGPQFEEEALKLARRAEYEVGRVKLGEQLLRDAARLVARHGNVSEAELLKRLGVLEREQAREDFRQPLAAKFQAGRFQFGAGAFANKPQRVEDPQLKQTNKYLSDLVTQGRRQVGAVWGN